MSTLNTFREMSGVTDTRALEITPEGAKAIIQSVSLNHNEQATGLPVNLLPVSTYVAQSKEEDSTFAYVYPKQPPFASHWGIVVGDPNHDNDAFLFHLLLRDKDGKRSVKFRAVNVDSDSDWIIGAAITLVKPNLPFNNSLESEMT